MLITDKIVWSQSADVIVVGLGSAGAVSAIASHDSGAEVLVLEKQPANRHISNSHMCDGWFICPTDINAAIIFMEHLAKADEELYWTDKDSIRVFAEYLFQNREWLENLGAKLVLRPNEKGGEYDVPGRETWALYCRLPGSGPGLMRFLKRQLETRGIKTFYDTPAEKILTNFRGGVIGVKARNKGEDIFIKARKAVIISSGGFEFNEEMKLNYLRAYPTHFAGSPALTGDGIRMAQEIGAALWHMNCCSASWVLKFPGLPIGLGPNFRGSKGGETEFRRAAQDGNPCGYFIVDRYGKRFTNEEFKRHALYYELAMYDSQSLEYPRIPSYWIFDHKRIKASPIPMMWYGPMLFRKEFSYEWSNDNQEEIKKGWIIQGDSIQELAKNLNMSPGELERTLSNYNSYCEQKSDPEFHRPQKHLVPLVEPPFYAIKLWPGSANTLGGPRRNQKGQIINVNGEVIPRLYSAGELGSWWGMLYQSGGNIAECIASGRIASMYATKEKPLD